VTSVRSIQSVLAQPEPKACAASVSIHVAVLTLSVRRRDAITGAVNPAQRLNRRDVERSGD
jgi:hypothetical protein